MAKTNTRKISIPVYTHEGAKTAKMPPLQELRRAALTCLLWEDTFYEGGNELATRIAGLVKQVKPEEVAALAIEARDKMQLRHLPLFLVRELARTKGNGKLVENTLAHVIQRADELTEYVSLYWREKKQPLSAASKRGLAAAFTKFDAYKLAKYNRDSKIKLRDVLFLTHAKPLNAAQAEVWKKLVDGTLESPDTWEVELSAGKDKKATFERLLREGKLGGLATLRNLRNMLSAGVDTQLIKSRLSEGIARALPFRFVTAARYAPQIESAIEVAMLKAAEGFEKLPGRTGLLIDVSGSMDGVLSSKGETTRLDAANGLAILLREIAEDVEIYTFSNDCKLVPPRRGFALRDAVNVSQIHGGTYLGKALHTVGKVWQNFDRIIIITDEQSHDPIPQAFNKRAYIINVAPYQYGVGYEKGYVHINGWSERVVDFIREYEKEN